MSRYDLKCKVIEEELKSVWPEWHVVCRLGGGAFGDVYQICRDNYGIRVDSALKVIQVSSDNDTADISFSGKAETRTDIPDSFRSRSRSWSCFAEHLISFPLKIFIIRGMD